MTTALAPTTVADLFGPAPSCDCLPGPVEQAIADGYVRRQVHPVLPLAILNYAEKTAQEGAWNAVTLACRGLIYNTYTFEVVARPFGKFFNYGQAGAPLLDLTSPAVVTDKADGSLGILYPTPDGYAVATRGSFISEQAIHATEVWNSRYASVFRPRDGFTLLFEIVYPANRVVLDYGDLDDLVYLGTVEIASGKTRSAAGFKPWGWYGPSVECMPYATLAEALAAPPRPGREGVVVHCQRTDQRIKIKYEEYVRLHRLVTGLTARTVWQHLVDGMPLSDLIEPLPDEFHDWVREVADDITAAVNSEEIRLHAQWLSHLRAMPVETDLDSREGRKAFAMAVSHDPDRWAMFAKVDGKDVRPELLRRAKPEAFVTPSGRTYTEDTA